MESYSIENSMFLTKKGNHIFIIAYIVRVETRSEIWQKRASVDYGEVDSNQIYEIISLYGTIIRECSKQRMKLFTLSVKI